MWSKVSLEEHATPLNSTTSPSILLLQGEKVPFEIEFIGSIDVYT